MFNNFKSAVKEFVQEEKETARLLVFGGYRSDMPVDPERLREEHGDDDDDDLPGTGLLSGLSLSKSSA